MDDYTRCCALPECGVTIEDIPGRPERRYCTAAHRVAARQARRAAMRPEQQARLAETLPWTADLEPAPTRPRTSEPRGGRNGPRTSRMAPTCARGWRGWVMVGVLVGGYAISSSDPVAPPPVGLVAPGSVPADEWAARAEVVLASVERQLDTIADTEAAWEAAKGDRADTPTPVAALADRRALLERRWAALRSQLDSYRALGPTRAELSRLEGDVARAVHTPLPDDGQETAAVTELVTEAIRNGGEAV